MKKIIRFLFWVFIILFIVVQILTLDKAPLPWYDETFFASIAHQWLQTGQMTPQVAIFQEVKLYGPIYFWLTGISLKLLGFGVFSFRLINLLSGFGVVWISSLILKHFTNHSNKPKQRLLKLWWILLLTDPLYYLVMHEGRMDLLALFWALSSIYLLLPFLTNSPHQPRLINRFFLSGILVALAVLTTPRVAFIFIPLGLVLLWSCRRKLHLLLIWGIVIIGIYAIWIFTAFGSLTALLEYYTGDNPFVSTSAVGWYMGGVGYIPRQSYPLIVGALLGLLTITFHRATKLFQPYIFIALISIGLFYSLVHDYGQYSVFILPFYYFLALYGLSAQPLQLKNWMMYPVCFLLLLNLGYFTLKNLQTLASWQQRKPTIATQFVQKHIPKGSRVIGEPMYFYAVTQAGSQYQYMDLYETLETREIRQRTQFKYQYMIVTDHLRWRKPQVVKHYLQKAQFKEIARLKTPPSYWTQQIARLGLVSNVERDGYDCVIYKRVTK
ncbi:hypothetical protein BKI52_31845 [marine bacterium AO1-C]|nr:hypothetical protein BKI52_31845 [marine bacterium AO1-C]